MSTARMTIGEVLSTLKEEFPDITVSKIRFLEGEGLISPERTASGYRKFGEGDLERLRFILRLQRDSFLPLKVIRDRLAAAAADGAEGEKLPPAALLDSAEPATEETHPATTRLDPDEELLEPLTALHLTESDLAGASGLERAQIHELTSFGVLCEHSLNGGTYFDQEDLVISRIARDFFKYGIEARHLKMIRQYAEREAALLEQVVAPVIRHRSPEARRQAANALAELARLTRRMGQAFLRRSLRASMRDSAPRAAGRTSA